MGTNHSLLPNKVVDTVHLYIWSRFFKKIGVKSFNRKLNCHKKKNTKPFSKKNYTLKQEIWKKSSLSPSTCDHTEGDNTISSSRTRLGMLWTWRTPFKCVDPTIMVHVRAGQGVIVDFVLLFVWIWTAMHWSNEIPNNGLGWYIFGHKNIGETMTTLCIYGVRTTEVFYGQKIVREIVTEVWNSIIRGPKWTKQELYI